MLKIPKEKIIELILEKTDLNDTTINEKIQRKMKELSGLISEEGAAHIIANELGVTVFEARKEGPLPLDEIYPGMRNVSANVKVITIYPMRTFTRNGTEGKVQTLLIADEKARLRCSLWHEATDLVADVQEGDIITINNASARENQGRTELSCNEYTTIERNPSGVSISNIAEFKPQEGTPIYIKDIDRSSRNVTLLGTLVQMYPPAFFVPRDQREENVTYTLAQKNGCVANTIIDDGTGTMRTAIFTEQLVAFTGKSVDELKDQDMWNACKDTLMGQLLKVDGNVQYNEQFQRNEMIARSIKKINAEEADKLLTTLGPVK